jgi:hypothetical protein
MVRKWTNKGKFASRARQERLNSFIDRGLRNLTRSQAGVYLQIWRHTRSDGTSRVSMTEMSERLGISRQATGRAVSALANMGVVRVVKRGVPGKSSLYTLFDSKVLEVLNPQAEDWTKGNHSVACCSDN